MKKFLFLAVAAVAMLATSCSKDETANAYPEGDTKVSFTVVAPELQTRTIGDGTTATTLEYAVYDANWNHIAYLDGTTTINLQTTVDLELIDGKTYNLIFWAENAAAPYTFDRANKKVTINYDGIKANNENLDAFYAPVENLQVRAGLNPTVRLYRPFAQLNIATSDWSHIVNSNEVFTQTEVEVKAYNTLNLVDGEVSGDAVRTFNFAAMPTETLSVNGQNYKWMAMNYLLVNEKELVEVTFNAQNNNVAEKKWYNVPVERNHRTHILGKLLTSSVDFEVIIMPDFIEPAEEYVDGVEALLTAIADATNGETITVAPGTYPVVLDITGAKNFTLKAAGEVVFAGVDHQTNGTPSTVTFEGITFDNSIVVTRAEGGWFTGTAPNIAPCVGAWGGDLTFNNCKFIVAGSSGRETGVMTWWTGNNQMSLAFNGCEFVGKNNHASARAMQIYGKVDMEVNNCTFTTAKDYTLKYVAGEGNVAVFNGNKVENSKYFVQLGSSGYPGKNYTVEINDTTLVGESVIYFIDNKEGQTVLVDGVTEIIGGEVAVAELNGKWYSSLNAAIAAIEGNEAEISVKAGTYNLPVVQNKSLTITGIGNREDIIVNVLPKASQNTSNTTLIFDNVTIQSQKDNYNGFFHTVACEFNNCVIKDLLFLYSPTKFNNCEFVATQTEHNVWTYGANEVEFVNCKFTYSDRCVNVYVDNGKGSAAVAFDGCTFVTENTTSKGAVEVNSSAFPQGVTVDFNGCTVPAYGEMAYVSQWDGTKGKTATITIDGNYFFVNGGEVDTVEVASVAELQGALALAAAPKAGNTVIELAQGEYTMPANWEPISVSGYQGAGYVTLDGNDATIKGLDAALFQGGFAGQSGIIIKNLTIEGATIVADNTQGYGAFVNCADSMEEITLENCHLINSTIITPNDGAAESRIGGLVGWTSGYSNQNDGPVKTYVTIKNCSVVGCTIKGAGSIGGICGHAGASDWTYTTIENCTVTNNKFISTDDGGWRVGVVVGTANVGEVTINNITESGNTLEQIGKTAPTGEKRNYYGRFVPDSTGKLTIDGVAIQ